MHSPWPQHGNVVIEKCETFCWFCTLEVKTAATLRKVREFQLDLEVSTDWTFQHVIQLHKIRQKMHINIVTSTSGRRRNDLAPQNGSATGLSLQLPLSKIGRDLQETSWARKLWYFQQISGETGVESSFNDFSAKCSTPHWFGPYQWRQIETRCPARKLSMESEPDYSASGKTTGFSRFPKGLFADTKERMGKPSTRNASCSKSAKESL